MKIIVAKICPTYVVFGLIFIGGLSPIWSYYFHIDRIQIMETAVSRSRRRVMVKEWEEYLGRNRSGSYI